MSRLVDNTREIRRAMYALRDARTVLSGAVRDVDRAVAVDSPRAVRALRRRLEDVEHVRDARRSDVERAVRSANPDATERQIQDACREL